VILHSRCDEDDATMSDAELEELIATSNIDSTLGMGDPAGCPATVVLTDAFIPFACCMVGSDHKRHVAIMGPVPEVDNICVVWEDE
jgi:hypothetical protein